VFADESGQLGSMPRTAGTDALLLDGILRFPRRVVMSTVMFLIFLLT